MWMACDDSEAGGWVLEDAISDDLGAEPTSNRSSFGCDDGLWLAEVGTFGTGSEHSDSSSWSERGEEVGDGEQSAETLHRDMLLLGHGMSGGSDSALGAIVGPGGGPGHLPSSAGERNAAHGAISTADLVARGGITKIERWQHFEQLLLDDEHEFEARPHLLTSKYGIFRESPKVRRRSPHALKMDRWNNSGGMVGSTVWPQGGARERVRCRYGKITCPTGLQLRYSEYTLLPQGYLGLNKNQLDRYVWQVYPEAPKVPKEPKGKPRRRSKTQEARKKTAQEARKKTAQEARKKTDTNTSPANTTPASRPSRKKKKRIGLDSMKRKQSDRVRIRDNGDALSSRLLDLGYVNTAVEHTDEFEMQDLKYISFVGEGREVGSLSASTEGLKLTTAAGDFAEWHELSDQAEMLKEGDVVGICHGKVSRRTARAAMVGVVTEKAAIVGSMSRWTGSRTRKGCEIAYCGRVPVRVRGPVREGDVVVSSGHEDGLAVVISNTSAASRDCDISCATEQRTTRQPALQVGVAMQACNQARDDVSLVEISVTGPSMSTSSMQLGKTCGAACTIRAVIFTTLFIALLSTAAVLFANHNIQSRAGPSKRSSRANDGDFIEVFPVTSLFASTVCDAGMAHRPESLMHLPCYLFQPRAGMPGTFGVFQPAHASNCDHVVSWDGGDTQEQLWVLEACWELQYGKFRDAYSDDPDYDKLHLVQTRWVSDAWEEHAHVLAKDQGPFRCQELWPQNVWQGCPKPILTCEDLVPQDTPTALTACTFMTLSDYNFEAKDLDGDALLYEQGHKNALDGAVYIRTLCPETCAARVPPAVRSPGNSISTGNATSARLGRRSSEPEAMAPSMFYNNPQSPGARKSPPATPTHLSWPAWWLYGVPKPNASHLNTEQPWLCLEDVRVKGPHNRTLPTFELGVTSYRADACASRSMICDPNAGGPWTTVCKGLMDDTSTDVPLMLAICPNDFVLNRTTGYCATDSGLGLPEWNASQAEMALQRLGLHRPWGNHMQVPGNATDRLAALLLQFTS